MRKRTIYMSVIAAFMLFAAPIFSFASEAAGSDGGRQGTTDAENDGTFGTVSAGDTVGESAPVIEVSDGTQLAEALKGAEDGTTIKLTDAVMCSGIRMESIPAITIYFDLGDHDLIIHSPGNNAIYMNYGNKMIQTGDGTGKFILSTVEKSSAVIFADGGEVDIRADLTGIKYGIAVQDGTKVSVSGSITVTEGYGIYAGKGTEVTLCGNIKAVRGVYAYEGAKVYVNGTIDAPVYIEFYDHKKGEVIELKKGEHISEADGYAVFSYSVEDKGNVMTTYVYVSADDNDDLLMYAAIAVIAAAAIGLAAYWMFIVRKR